MTRAELAEIRALLQANTPVERRPRAPLLGTIRSLLTAPIPHARPTAPPPRRVGLRPAEPADIEAVEDLLLSEPVAEDQIAEALEARRRAFGQRPQEVSVDPLPVLRLAAPLPSSPTQPAADAAVGEILRRRGLTMLVAHPEETPYHPEDLSDHVEGDAEQIYADSGLFEPGPAAPKQPGARIETDPQRRLLQHLERVLMAEQAALG